MNLVDQVKKISGNLVLKQAIAKGMAAAETISFEKATKFGILFYARTEAEMVAVTDLISFLWEHKKTSIILGATIGFPVAKSRLTNMNFTQLKEEEFDWRNIPRGYRILNFLDNDFDILIDLTQEDYLPVTYLLALSKSKIKVGRYDRNSHGLYHFMLDTWQKPDIFNFTDQVKQYLLSL